MGTAQVTASASHVTIDAIMVENAFRAWQAQPTNVSDDARAAPHLKPDKGWQNASFNELRLQHMMRCVDAAKNLTEYFPSQVLVDPSTGVAVETTNATLRYLAGPFMELPDPESSPEYYRAILKPMSISTIRAKIETGGYTVWSHMRADVLQVWNLTDSVSVSDSVSDSVSVSVSVSDSVYVSVPLSLQMFQTAATFNPPHAQVCVDANKCITAFIQAEQETPDYLMVAPPSHTLKENGKMIKSGSMPLRSSEADVCMHYAAAGGHEEGAATERTRTLSRHSEMATQLEQQHLAAQIEQQHLRTVANPRATERQTEAVHMEAPSDKLGVCIKREGESARLEQNA